MIVFFIGGKSITLNTQSKPKPMEAARYFIIGVTVLIVLLLVVTFLKNRKKKKRS
jgi:cbb3-type cytochrome oxidase subunit 3